MCWEILFSVAQSIISFGVFNLKIVLLKKKSLDILVMF